MGRGGSNDEPDDEGLYHRGRYEWERWIRRCCVPATVKHVALNLSTYASRDGSSIYPGVARLSATTGLSERSVRQALVVLREIGLIKRTRKGSTLGRQALTDEHILTIPADLERRVHLLDPEESPASAACDPSCHPAVSPVRRSGDRVATGTEHRQEVPGTPATGAGTPATGDRITGTTCTPPKHDHAKYQPTNQRDDSASVTEVQTARDDDGDNVIVVDRWGGVA